MSKQIGLLEFIELYRTEEACKTLLCDLKWSRGYSCRRCGHTEQVKGATHYHRRCQKCKYDESPTAHTLFHKLKFPMPKAFAIIYQLGTMKKGMSTCEIARQYGIHQETAWFFKKKVMTAMSAQKSKLLSGCVEVDETMIGGFEAGKPGRSHGKKKKVQVALEIDYDDEDSGPIIRGADARVITGYSAEELGQGIDQMVDQEAMIVTDGLPAYSKASGERVHDWWPSDDGENFEKLHWHIFNLKNWIRGIHHHVSDDHIQFYLNEFHFRFRNRNWIKECPQKIFKLMMSMPWIPYEQLCAA